MKYIAVKPVKKGCCEGCVFSTTEKYGCTRTSVGKYRCIVNLEHKYIFIAFKPVININTHIL